MKRFYIFYIFCIGREGGSTATNFGFQNLSPFKKQHIFRHHFESDGRKASPDTFEFDLQRFQRLEIQFFGEKSLKIGGGFYPIIFYTTSKSGSNSQCSKSIKTGRFYHFETLKYAFFCQISTFHLKMSSQGGNIFQVELLQ